MCHPTQKHMALLAGMHTGMHTCNLPTFHHPPASRPVACFEGCIQLLRVAAVLQVVVPSMVQYSVRHLSRDTGPVFYRGLVSLS